MKRTTTDEAPDLHERIKRWRVAKKLSQTQIAEGLGITVSAVSYWEGGGKKRTSPSHENLARLVEFLGLTIPRFYGRLPEAP